MPSLPMTSTTPGQRFNALKHGRHAHMLLLPGEDLAEFRRRRRAAFHRYRPQTEDEAHLVEGLVEHCWRLERWRPLEAELDGQAMCPAADLAGRVCEPDAHQRLHSSMDAILHLGRVDRLWDRTLSRLLALQGQRRKGLIPGAERLPAGCYMETDGTVYGPIVSRPIVPLPEPDLDADSIHPTDSTASPFGIFQEQKETHVAEGTETQQPKAGPVGRTSPSASNASAYMGSDSEDLPEAPGHPAPDSNADSIHPTDSTASPFGIFREQMETRAEAGAETQQPQASPVGRTFPSAGSASTHVGSEPGPIGKPSVEDLPEGPTAPALDSSAGFPVAAADPGAGPYPVPQPVHERVPTHG